MGGGVVPSASRGSTMPRAQSVTGRSFKRDYNEVPRCAWAENPHPQRLGEEGAAGEGEQRDQGGQMVSASMGGSSDRGSGAPRSSRTCHQGAP